MPEEEFRAEAGAERRRYSRKPLKLRVKYKCISPGSISTTNENIAEDLGAGGLAMHCQHALERDQIVMLTLYLPVLSGPGSEQEFSAVPENECTPVDILSRIAWCRPAQAGGYNAGVQFLDLDKNDRQGLKAFLVEYQLDSPDSYLYT